MFIYMSKKIAIPKQSHVTCLAWNHSSGYIAVGGEEGMLKVLKLESGGSGNLSMNLSLEGHNGQLRVAIWNEVFQKLTTSDEHGVIIVWMLYKGSWYEEMINNRNKSTVAGMAWGSDGQKICIAYEDGAVIVGGVDGSRVWGKDVKGPGLAAVQWSPDNTMLLFALTNGELHLYDDQGNFTMPVAIQGVVGSMEVIAMDWFAGRAPANRPVLAICYKNGIVLLMKNCTEEDSVVVESNMKALDCRWNHNGTVLAVAGCTAEDANAVQFFNAYGEHIRTLRVPGGSMRALSWERRSLRLAIAIDSFIYFANVKPDHKYAFYGNTLAFVSAPETVTFWDTVTHQSWINHIPDVIDMCGVEEYCVIATPNTLIISNQQGIQCDAKAASIPVCFVSINSKDVAVAASKECFLIWKFSTPTRPRSTELMFHVDGSPITGNDSSFQDDTISCVTCSDSHLLVGRDSGSILLFSMVNFKKITSINMNAKPYKLGLNSNSSKFFVIDQPGSLYLLNTDMTNNISIGQAIRKDVWSALWATDNPAMLAIAEKARLYVMRDNEPEEPLTMQGYLCRFKELEIVSALLDSMSEKCTPQHIVRVEVKSLRDTRQLIEKVGLNEAESFIKDNPHPQLWLLLAEAALKNFEQEGALETAEAAFVRRGDYAGIKFVSRLTALHSNALKKAEIFAYFKDFDAAEKIYLNEDRRDLAISLRKRLGHWFRVVELLKMSPNTTESQIKQAYSNIGDYYLDRQNWSGAIEYYTMCNNTDGLKKCYMALEDNEALAKLCIGSPKVSRDSTSRQSLLDEGLDPNQPPTIQGVMQLKDAGRFQQAAAMALQLANTEASKKSSPLLVKKLYVLAGHLYTKNSVDGAASREASRAYRLCLAQHWLWLAARAASRPPRTPAALRAAARLAAVAGDLHDNQHVQDSTSRQSLLDEGLDPNQPPTIQGVMQLKDAGRFQQAAAMALQSLSGHTTPVECVCFNHSEDLVCAGSQTGALKIWDLEAAKLLRTFTGHKGAIKCMDFHPYGDYLTTGSCDSNIKLWDTRKRGCIVTYSSHRLAVNSLQFSPDGQWIASACEDGIVKVWDVRVGKVLQEFIEHTAAVTSVKFHPHEFLLASCGLDKTVNFWDMEKFQLVSKFEKQNTSVRQMIFSDDGATLLGCGNDGLYVVGWEPARVLDVVAGHWGQIQDVTVAHTQLIAGSFHSTYVVLSVVDLKKVHPFGGPPPSPSFVNTSPFQKGQSVRKSFSKERPARTVVHRPTPLEEKTTEESTSGTEADEESGAVISNINDYTEIFRPSRSLNRTPPPAFSMSSEDSMTGHEKLEDVGTSLRDLILDEPSRPPPQPSPPERQRPDPPHSRIPTSVGAKEHYGALFARTEDWHKETNTRGVVTAPIRDYANFSAGAGSLNRHNSYKETKSSTEITSASLRQSNSEISLGPPSLGPRSLSFTRTPSETNSAGPGRRRLDSVGRDTRERVDCGTAIITSRAMRDKGVRDAREVRDSRDADPEPEVEFVPCALDRPVGLDLDEFLPRTFLSGGTGVRGARGGGAEPSEQEALGAMMRGHDAMMAVLSARERALQIFNSIRLNKDLKAALESAIALDDISVIVDILNVMATKPSLWNLDICQLMLPKIYELLQSKYESYMQSGCNALRLIVRNFSSVVRTNISAPVRTLGVDIPREERYHKCIQIHKMLVDIRAFLLKRQTLQGRLGAAFRDLHTLMQQGLD